jgi:hypothetical protein
MSSYTAMLKKKCLEFLSTKETFEDLLNQNIKETEEMKSNKATKIKTLGPLDAEFDLEGFLSKQVKSATEFYNALNPVLEACDNQFEIQINNEWYPVKGVLQLRNAGLGGGKIAYLTASYKVCDRVQNYWMVISDSSFFKEKHMMKDLLDCRMVSNKSIEIARDKAKRCGALLRTNNVVDVNSSVLVWEEMFFGGRLSPISFGNKNLLKSVIVESRLEACNEFDEYYEDEYGSEGQPLPFIRAFSLDLKEYVYVDIDNSKPHVFTNDSKDRIVLPTEFMRVLNACFGTDNKNMINDMFNNRHGGLVILANGPSGVGKTLTAEVFAECSSRPLYVMEMGELGTNLEHVEQSLKKIFKRAARWNAILLFDEADIFLTKRGDNLERSAIVGVFLRLLDNYNGTFFLTTNRGDVMDDAFKSRITMKLDYPALNDESREKIWRLLLANADYQLTEDSADNKPLSAIAKEPFNGRQIRNLVRLLKILYPGDTVSTKEIESVFHYAAK